jgi:hypothetical protein
MKRLLIATFFLGAFVIVPTTPAQEHGQLGAFADYLRLQQTGTNNWGLGGRLSLNPSRYFMLEGELAYDFGQGFTEGFTDTTTGTVTLTRSSVRILHGMFGPTLQTGHGPVRFFITAKGGFMNFRFDQRAATFATFTSSVETLRTNNVSAVFYPGGGLDAHIGPIGVRLDVGDEIYFANGAHHNMRVAFGPMIRF